MNTRNNTRYTVRTLTAAALIGLSGSLASAQTNKQTDTSKDKQPTTKEINRAVQTELLTARHVSSGMIDVEMKDGIVTLTGTAPTLLDKHRAVELAGTVRGVRSVVDRIMVVPMERSSDAIAKDVAGVLAMDPAADAYELNVRAEDQIVHLKGEVDSWHERELARTLASSVRGVRDVVLDGVTVTHDSTRPDREIRSDVRSRLKWDRWVDQGTIDAEVSEGTVRLIGTVGSTSEKERAKTLAHVKGAKEVDTTGLTVSAWAKDNFERTPERASEFDDRAIEQAVEDAMYYDPRVISGSVLPEAEDGVVTLTGIVDNLRAKHAAKDTASNTTGVKRVYNMIHVRPNGSGSMDREELREDVLAAIERDPWVWREGKFVRIEGHNVVLIGDARSEDEADRAVTVVAAVPGVISVKDGLQTSDRWEWKPDHELVEDVRSQLFWSPFVDSDDIRVDSDNGIVTLTGEVDDWSELASARENAWDANPKGVRLDLELTDM